MFPQAIVNIFWATWCKIKQYWKVYSTSNQKSSITGFSLNNENILKSASKM